MRFDAILMDADDTLFDFGQAERRAIEAVASDFGIEDAGAPERYAAINAACWADFEAGRITQDALKLRRFREFLDHYGRGGDAEAASEAFLEALSAQSMLFPGALEVVAAIAKARPIAIVTNGIARVQRGRFERSPIRRHIRALVISEEVGAPKPQPDMFFEALRRLGSASPERALMIGDSLTSDMAGARAAGVVSCWYNPSRLPAPPGAAPDYTIHTLREMPEIALM